MDSIIRLEAVTKRYRKKGSPARIAVDHLSLTVSGGQILGLLGPPGAGKTTLLRLITGDLKPSTGARRVLVREAPLFAIDEPAHDVDLTTQLASARMNGRAVVVATASVRLAYALCDRVIILDRGKARAERLGADLAPLVEQEEYQIRLKGHLGPHQAIWFEGLSMMTTGSDTVLAGPVADQAALHGLLRRVRDLGLPLLEVVRTEPDLKSLYEQ